MTAHPSTRLSDYLDGDLSPATRDDIEAHLRTCAVCRGVVEDLRALQASTAAWAAASTPPVEDLWPGIAARLSGPRSTAGVADAGQPIASTGPVAPAASSTPWYRRRWTVGVPELALAASLVAAVSGLVWYRPAAVPGPATTDVSPVVAEVESFGSPDAGVVPVSFADAQYDAAINDLERVLLVQRDRLDPRTVIVL